MERSMKGTGQEVPWGGEVSSPKAGRSRGLMVPDYSVHQQRMNEF